MKYLFYCLVTPSARSSLPSLVTPLTQLCSDVVDFAFAEATDFVVSFSFAFSVCRCGNSEIDSGSNDSSTF